MPVAFFPVNTRCFNTLQESAKLKILKGVGVEDFVITEGNIEKFY